MKLTGWSWQAVLTYLLLQIPGTLLVIGLLWLLHTWTGLQLWIVWSLVTVWVIKDGILFFFVWPAYEPSDRIDTFSLIGLTGTARERLAPEGLVKIRGELWRARLADSQPSIEAGDRVKVLERRGLLLLVQADGSHMAGRDGQSSSFPSEGSRPPG
jgi:membrane protein implicated in regulation of membrane protease activity